MNKTQMLVVVLLGAAACGGDAKHAGNLPWEGPRTQVISMGKKGLVTATPRGDDCVVFGDACLKPQDECGPDVSADVVVDAKGRVLEVICYPDGKELTVEEVEARDGDIAQNMNKSVLFVPAGVELSGGLAVDANKVVVYGEGPELSRIDGDVLVEGNNIIVHGLHITGDVHIQANNALFVQCVIEGALVIDGNNAVLTSSDVFGTVSVNGNNAELTANRFAADLSLAGKNARCEENYAAVDANGDGAIAIDEVGDGVACE